MANGNSPFYPNRVTCEFSANSTAWNIIATDGVGYATYQALLDAGKKPYPGDNNDFPRGIPNTLVRSSASNAAGSTFLTKTNTINTPTSDTQAEVQVGGTDQQFGYEHASVRQLWLRKTVGTDVIIILGMF